MSETNSFPHLSDHLHPNTLFKYLNLRQAKAYKPEAVPIHVGVSVYERIPANVIKNALIPQNLLYPVISGLRSSTNAQKDITTAAKSYQSKSQFLTNEDNAKLAYPELAEMVTYLDGYGNAIDHAALLIKLKAILNETLDVYLKSSKYYNSKLVIWDNILAHVISTQEYTPLTLLCKFIGAMNVMELLNSTSSNVKLTSEEIYKAYRIQPLIPDWLVRVLLVDPISSDESVNAKDHQEIDLRAELQERYELCQSTITSLEEAFRSKLSTSVLYQDEKNELVRLVIAEGLDKEAERAKIKLIEDQHALKFNDPHYIAGDDKSLIPSNVLSYILAKYNSLARLNINTIISSEVALSQSLMSQIGIITNNPTLYVADALITNSDSKCQHYDSNPYCDDGRQSTKPFVSAGSFVNAMIVGDLLVTRQQLIKYDLGEVAHIENILSGETKTRTHRHLERTEVTTTFESETENESIRDTQTTERYSMEKESNKVISTDFNVDAGVNATADYGTVQVSAYVNGGYSTSNSESNSEATKYSKDVTERALNRVKTLVREMKTIQILKETEETNVHELTNGTPDHVNGVYRWVDKFYLNRIVNYGKRLMLEFQIPEPSNFYLFRNIQQKLGDNPVEKPKTPASLGINSAASITDLNYTLFTAAYGMSDFAVPPQRYKSFSKSFKSAAGISQSGDQYMQDTHGLTIEVDGYEAYQVSWVIITPWWGDYHTNVSISNQVSSGSAGTFAFPVDQREIKSIGVAVYAEAMGYTLNTKVFCERSQDLYTLWQAKIYGQIIEAYNAKMDAYEAWLNNQLSSQVLIEGNNPDMNRSTERTELKKRCIEMFSGQRFESNDAAVDGIYNLSGYPEILFNEAIKEGNIAKFFEHAFEWENMTYIFYDYFYGRKKKWLTLTKLDDKSDPIFRKFLQAGNARVNVPVRPGYEKLVMMFHVLSNWATSIGSAWNFNPQIFGLFNLSTEFSPGIENGTYISIAEELRAAENLNDLGTFDVDTMTGEVTTNIIDAYIQKVPTNLVYLANDSGPYADLPDFTTDTEVQEVMTYFGL
jgi:hypothetical protein